jgi:DNA replication protein DnaC
MNEPPRKLRSVPSADALAEVLSLVPELTDEEWAARDAAVAAARAKEIAAQADARVGELEEYGFPLLALSEIRAGIDLAAPAIARLRNTTGSGIVVLSGPHGCGKTLAATWWAAQRRDRVRFLRASEFATSSRYEREARTDLFSSPLVLDDLGAEYVDTKGNFLSDLDALVDTFYADMRPLVITTNCTYEKFKLRYDARITDRLSQRGRWISLNGASLRGKAPRCP